jgi:hypothetical protein
LLCPTYRNFDRAHIVGKFYENVRVDYTDRGTDDTVAATGEVVDDGLTDGGTEMFLDLHAAAGAP